MTFTLAPIYTTIWFISNMLQNNKGDNFHAYKQINKDYIKVKSLEKKYRQKKILNYNGMFECCCSQVWYDQVFIHVTNRKAQCRLSPADG